MAATSAREERDALDRHMQPGASKLRRLHYGPQRSNTMEVRKEQARKPRPLARLRLRHHKNDFKPCLPSFKGVPRMNIAVLVVGSRGDVQPFIALAQVLSAPPYNHRVRICTHPNFKDFVEENGLEFYSIGGDPEKLMSYMVRNPGIMPTMASIKAGDVGDRRREIKEMLMGCWRACTEAGNGIDPIELRRHDNYEKGHEDDIFKELPPAFTADAIISNPPAYANINIAERLGVPLHMMFTMPWSPTTAFSQPLANVDQTRGDVKLANLMSFYEVDLMTWQGLGDLINDFREKELLLDPIDPAWGHMLIPHLRVPFTYFWSEALIPKPKDWHDHITISGFQFLSLASSFKPPKDLEDFLAAGPPPVYIGFGSIVVDDPNKLTTIILDAIKATGVRALVSKGWGGLGGDNVPDDVFYLGNVPHDWLFPRCSAVVHHGGAGTTAIGIALGKPTVIVPFFGDQPFWADMVHRAGAGPAAIRYKDLTAEKLADQLRKVLQPEVRERAEELAAKIAKDTGAQTAAKQFHATPQMQNLGCFLLPDHVAVYRVKRTNIRLCPLAVAILLANGKLRPGGLTLVRNVDWRIEEGPQDPFVALIATVSNAITGYISDTRQYRRDLSKVPPHSTDGVGKHPHGRTTKATAKFAGLLVARTLRTPLDLTYNLACGFHNAPAHLLRDRSVRDKGHITGLVSGLKTAVVGSANELFDAVTGLVTQPYMEVKRRKEAGKGNGSLMLGGARGFGRGIGAGAVKICAAAVGLPGYTFKGIEREAECWLRMAAGESDEHSREYFARAHDWLGREWRRRRGSQAGDKALQAHDRRNNTLWAKRKGPGAMRRTFERRAWESLSQMHDLTLLGQEEFERVESEVVERWNSLLVPDQFA